MTRHPTVKISVPHIGDEPTEVFTSGRRPDLRRRVIFINNVCCLRMCGHGTIGLVTTLGHTDINAEATLIIDPDNPYCRMFDTDDPALLSWEMPV